MAFKKIQYEQASGTIFQVEKESTGFIPFRVTTSGIVANTADFSSTVSLLGSAGLELEAGNLEVGGQTFLYGAIEAYGNTAFEGPVSFNGTTIFTVAPTGLVPTSRSIFSGTGLTGGGDLTTNRTISIASSGVGTTQLANSSVSTSKLQDNSVTDAKLADTYVKMGGSTPQTEVTRYTISGWNMDTTPTYTITHGLNFGGILRVTALITNNAGTNKYDFISPITGSDDLYLGGGISITTTNIILVRNNTINQGFFDNSSFNNASGQVLVDSIIP